MSNGSMLTAAIAKIVTQSAGGWKYVLDIPESMREVVKQHVGTENKKVYNVTFDEVGDLEQPAKRKPGRPKEEAAE